MSATVAMTIGPNELRTHHEVLEMVSWLAADGHDANVVGRVWVLSDGEVELDVYKVDAAGLRYRDPLTGEAAMERVRYTPSTPPPAALHWSRA